MTGTGASGDAGAGHAALVAALADADAAPAAVLDAFAAVPRHPFLPGVPLEDAYRDDAIVTATEDGVPTSSSSQPSLMARMLAHARPAAGPAARSRSAPARATTPR